jgi:uncharacterized protein YeaO (DUF488 family)
MIKIRRAYDKPKPREGYRILIDRLWPRGIKKEDLVIDLWQKNIAPSSLLRKWFKHDVKKWEEFKHRFYKELETKRNCIDLLLEKAKQEGTITLIYGAKEERYNNAVALKQYLEDKLKNNNNKDSDNKRVRRRDERHTK